jgi:hypothetical protein
MNLEIELALQGDPEEWQRQTLVAYLLALKESVTAFGEDTQAELRSEVVAAGLGQGVANAWRLDIYDNDGHNPAAWLHSKAAKIIDNFTRAEPYGPRLGKFLAIPIPGSPADALRVKRGQKRTDIAASRFGPLKVVGTRRGGLMIVGFGRDNGKGGFRALATRRHKGSGETFTPVGQAVTMIPLFWLVRQARVRKRLNWPDIAQRRKTAFVATVSTRVQRRIDAAQSAYRSRHGPRRRL